jgi:RimJ/RimL family protein N-acetyltransferase
VGFGDGVVSLRKKREADVGGLVAACQDPQIPLHTRAPSPYGEEDARRWLEVSEAGRLAGTDLSLLVVDRSDRLLGSVGLHEVSEKHRRAEIGYWTAAEARGRGVATRAVRLMAHHAFETLPLERIDIAVEPANDASRRVAERAGFRPDGLLRAWTELNGRQIDVIMHSLLRPET